MNVFITGGTSGIGLALLRRYVAEGHRVAAFALPEASPDPVFDGNATRAVLYAGDVRDAEALRRAVASFAQGRLDLMIACAGINNGFAAAAWPSFPREREIVEVNVLGVLNAFEAALAVMGPARGGQLAAVASASGLLGIPGSAGYSASKAAVITLCEAYAIELARHGIGVTCVAPGFVATPLTEGNPEPMPFLVSAQEAADRIARAIARGEEFVVFPWQFRLLAALLAVTPRSLVRALFKRAHARKMAQPADPRGGP